jgi:hypothetical protein
VRQRVASGAVQPAASGSRGRSPEVEQEGQEGSSAAGVFQTPRSTPAGGPQPAPEAQPSSSMRGA